MSSKEDQFLIEIYKETLEVLKKGINAGAANPSLSIASLDAYFDLLHGGAYHPAKEYGGNNSIPSYMAKVGAKGNSNFDSGLEVNSPYYVGATWLDLQQDAFTIVGINVPQIGTKDAQDILSNANVPMVFPKLLSDQFYSRWVLWRAQILSTMLLTSTVTGLGTGLKTFVQAVEPLSGIIGGSSTAITDSSDNQ